MPPSPTLPPSAHTCARLHELSLQPGCREQTPRHGISVALPWWWLAPIWACAASHCPHAARGSASLITRWGVMGAAARHVPCVHAQPCVRALAVYLQPRFFAPCLFVGPAHERGSEELGRHASTPFLLGEAWWFAWVDAFTPLISRGPPPSTTTPPEQHHLDHRGE